MSAGFFGSFFKRSVERERRHEPAPEDTGRAVASDSAPEAAPTAADSVPSSQEVQPRNNEQKAPIAEHRLSWLADFMDGEQRPDTRTPIPPAEEAVHAEHAHRQRDEVDSDYANLRQAIDAGQGKIDERPYWMDEDGGAGRTEREFYPQAPEHVVDEVDFVEPADPSTLSGDGHAKPTPPEARYHESSPRSFRGPAVEPPSAAPRSDDLGFQQSSPPPNYHPEERAHPHPDSNTGSTPDVPYRPEPRYDTDVAAGYTPGSVAQAEEEQPPIQPQPEPEPEPQPEPEAKPEPQPPAGQKSSPEPEAEAIPDAPIDEQLIEQIRRTDRVVAMLLRKEVVNPQQVANAQQQRERQGRKELLWRVLASLKTVDAEAVYAEAAQVYAFKAAALSDGGLDVDFARSVMDTFSQEKRDRLIEMRVIPFQAAMEGRTGAIKLIFITHDPTHPELHRFMQDMKLERFELQYAPESLVEAFILEAFPRKNEYLERMSDGKMRYDLGASFQEDASLIDEDALEAEINRSSLINLFEATLVEAVRRGASDIHIFPNADKHIEVHFRIDGRLGHWHTEEKVHPEALLAVIKDNAMNVDRFERDSAQDGFIQRWIDDALIRFRVSVLPIANATQELRSESIVIRVLDDRKVITDLEKLGLLDTAKERFQMAISQPHGMVILTGPTGSGKSTTLVAAMHQVVTPEVNVLTVEDPVEYIIPGVRQIKLNHKLGLEEALRAILRHDPDVVMVGEMRDRQTADLAIKLANTGHLTFSTLHTNDAPSAVSRLYKMGIEPFLIAYAINMVVAQRLIRTLCPECKHEDPDPDHIMLKKLGFTEEDIATRTIYKAGDNPNCRSCKGMGYKGRRAVTEALYFSRPIRHLIVEAQNMIDEEAIRRLAIKEGMLTLRDSAREIVKMGETSVTEMIRVVTTDA